MKTSRPGRGGASRLRTDRTPADGRTVQRPAGRGAAGRPAAPGEVLRAEEALRGRRVVLEALRAGRPLRKVLVARTAHGDIVAEIVHEARRRGVAVQVVDPLFLHDGPEAQGVVGLTSARATVQVADLLAAAAARGEPPFLLVLDGVEDPANLGALIRTADGAGVHGVVIPRHRAAGLTPAVARASAGAVEHVPVAVVANLVRAIEDLKRAGLWVVGTDMDAPQLYHEARLLPPLAVVMGGEGRGLGRLVRQHCDLLVRLPMRGRVGSLNVSVAAGVLLYDIVRQMGELTSRGATGAPGAGT